MTLPKRTDDRVISISERVYRLILHCYPSQFQKEYWTSMEQVFRDQCKEARARNSRFGLGMLWMRDSLVSVVREHWRAIDATVWRSQLTFRKVFAVTLVLLIPATALVSIFLLPKVYSSTARVVVVDSIMPRLLVDRLQGGPDSVSIQSQLENIKSKDVLFKVIEELDLTKWLADQVGAPNRLATDQAYSVLQRMIDAHQIPGSRLVDVKVFSEDGIAGAKIANKIVEVYVHNKQFGNLPNPVRVIDQAVPAMRPVRPKVSDEPHGWCCVEHFHRLACGTARPGDVSSQEFECLIISNPSAEIWPHAPLTHQMLNRFSSPTLPIPIQPDRNLFLKGGNLMIVRCASNRGAGSGSSEKMASVACFARLLSGQCFDRPSLDAPRNAHLTQSACPPYSGFYEKSSVCLFAFCFWHNSPV